MSNPLNSTTGTENFLVFSVLAGLGAADSSAERVLDNAANVHGDSLVVGRQAVKEVLECLAIADNSGASELDGDDSSLAVLGTLNFLKNRKLVEVGGDGDLVAARDKEKVGDGEITNVGVVNKVGKGGVANVKSEIRSIGDIGGGLEIRLTLLGGDIDLSAINRGAVEQIQALHVDGFLEGNVKLGGQARRLDLCLSVHGDVESLVGGEPNVEGVEGVMISNGDILADVDELVLVAVCLGEGDVEERSLAREILEVHDTVKAVDVGLDGAIGGDGGVDLQGDAIRLGVDDVDALDIQLGVVDLLLGDLGNSNEDDEADDQDNNAYQEEQICPPKALQMAQKPSLLGRSRRRDGLLDSALGLVDLGALILFLVGHFF